MKLADLQEARYHIDHPLVAKIKAAIKVQDWKWTKVLNRFDDSVLGILEGGLGKPDRYDPEDKHHYAIAEWRVNDTKCLNYLFGKSPNEDDLVNYMYFTNCVGQPGLQEARYHIDHPLVAEIKAAIKSDDWEWRKLFNKLDPTVLSILKGGFGNPDRFDPEDEESYAVAEWRINDQKCLNYLFGRVAHDMDDIANYIFFTICHFPQ